MSSDTLAPALDESAVRQLARVIRGVFPHDDFSDGPYLRSARSIADDTAGSGRRLGVVSEGLRSVRDLAGGDLEAIPLDALTGILRHIQQTEFFQLVLTSAVVSLYSDAEVYDTLGYEGSSFEKGGYLHRGFDDLRWLPEPRIEEYDGDPLIEYAPVVPGLLVSFENTARVEAVR